MEVLYSKLRRPSFADLWPRFNVFRSKAGQLQSLQSGVVTDNELLTGLFIVDEPTSSVIGYYDKSATEGSLNPQCLGLGQKEFGGKRPCMKNKTFSNLLSRQLCAPCVPQIILTLGCVQYLRGTRGRGLSVRVWWFLDETMLQKGLLYKDAIAIGRFGPRQYRYTSQDRSLTKSMASVQDSTVHNPALHYYAAA